MNKFWVVALETYKRNVKSMTFIIMILAPFLLVGISLLVGLVGNQFEKTSNIAVISSDQAVRESYIQQSTLDVATEIESVEQAQKALEAEEIDGYLLITADESAAKVAGEFFGTASLGTDNEMEIANVLTSIQLGFVTQSLKVSAEDVQKLTEPAAFVAQTVEFNKGEMEEKGMNRLAMTLGSVFIGLAMYMIILMYAQVTSSEVASEKGTRIMEIILSSTSAAKHFYGKVMGIFLVILTQVFVYLLLGVGAFFFSRNLAVVKDFLKIVSVKELIGGFLGYNLLYLLLGVVIYTILAALCGSLVSKAEDAGKAAAPVTYLTIAGFLLSSMFGMSNPQHILIKVTSYIPFLSSFTMPARIASGTVTNTGVFISLAILCVSTVLLLKVSAVMYRSTALVYSDDGMWKAFKQSLNILKSEKN